MTARVFRPALLCRALVSTTACASEDGSSETVSAVNARPQPVRPALGPPEFGPGSGDGGGRW